VCVCSRVLGFTSTAGVFIGSLKEHKVPSDKSAGLLTVYDGNTAVALLYNNITSMFLQVASNIMVYM